MYDHSGRPSDRRFIPALLASLIIRLPRRPGDQLMLHTLVISMLLLGIALVSRLLF